MKGIKRGFFLVIVMLLLTVTGTYGTSLFNLEGIGYALFFELIAVLWYIIITERL
ncbi:MAG: hypothetical protein K8E24_015020 [Methanobacterium paludis]|nr:hypothetical protein [Methanobacterium paludis]